MIVFVRYNQGPGVALELQEESRVAELKDVVGGQQGVRPERLRVLFAGRELHSCCTLQSCDLPEQSTVHVVLSSGSSSQLLPLQEPQRREEQQDGLAQLDLSSLHLFPSSSHQAASLEDQTGGGAKEIKETQQPADPIGVRRSSTFFVYCKSCKSINPGKLRVRCHGCKQTTMTLSRGPSCWDDVLLPGRVHGVCQSDGCLNTEAEFYMKCASHPTSEEDSSVALHLLMTNTREVPCIACTDVMKVVLVFQCSERHVICLDCFRGYSQTRLNERQFVHDPNIGYTLPCAAGCSDSLIKDVHHFRVLPEDQYGRYLQYGAEECLLAIGGLMCPSPGCGAGLVPPAGGRRVECDVRLGCGFVFCRHCREADHQGACSMSQNMATEATSSDFVVEEEASRRGRWDQESLLCIQKSTKLCPQCSVPVERNGGCMHMHCIRCGADWCWFCGVFWNRDCMGNHWFE